MLSTPFLSITTISPCSISLIKSAPIISSAQVSDDKIYESLSFPNTSGLIPYGSLIPTSFLLVIIVRAYPPCT